MSRCCPPGLELRPVPHAMAREACRSWHYSRTVAAVCMLRLGVFEHGRFIGVVVFGSGACPFIGRPYGLDLRQVCELTRVALDSHGTPVSRIVSIAIRLLKRARPAMRLIVSYADPDRGHAGGIYQAGNWTYAGTTKPERFVRLPDGRIVHPRSAYDLFPDRAARLGLGRVEKPPKHKYLYPLDGGMKATIAHLARPYPRVASIDGDAPDPQSGQGGSSPTATLDN